MKSNPWQYAKCHQCTRCGLTRPLEALKLFHRVDAVLGIEEHVYVCTDAELCARMKVERDEHLRLDAERRAVEREERQLERAAATIERKAG